MRDKKTNNKSDNMKEEKEKSILEYHEYCLKHNKAIMFRAGQYKGIINNYGI